MNTRHQSGLVAELSAAARMVSLGYHVYFPLMTQSKADFVMEKAGRFSKVQVKKATYCTARGNPFIQVRLAGHGRGSYEDGDFDFLLMVYEERMWLFPWSFVKGKTSMSFSIFEGQKPYRPIAQYELV